MNGALCIDPISAASPDMSESEMQALKDSIATIGQQVPIIVWRDRVIDGRKRLAACAALAIQPKITTISDDSSPADYANALNLIRTHYTPSQRAMFADSVANATKSDGPAGRWANSPIYRATDTSPDTPVVTKEQAAKMFGINSTTVKQARRVRRDAEPEVVAAVEAGHLTLHSAEKISREVPRDRQASVVEQIKSETKGKRNTPSKIINAAAPGKRRSQRRDLTAVRNRSLQTINACCTALGQFMDDPFGEESDFSGWSEWVTESLAILNKFNRRMEKARERSA